MPTPIYTYTDPGTGALFNQNGWSLSDRANFLRSGNLGPFYQYIDGETTANRVNYWDGSGPYTLRLVPNNNTTMSSGSGGAWLGGGQNLTCGIVYYPGSIKADEAWEMAFKYTASGAHTKKTNFVVGLAAFPRMIPPTKSNSDYDLRDTLFDFHIPAICIDHYGVSGGNGLENKSLNITWSRYDTSSTLGTITGSNFGTQLPASGNSSTETIHHVYRPEIPSLRSYSNGVISTNLMTPALLSTFQGLLTAPMDSTRQTTRNFLWNPERYMFPFIGWVSPTSGASAGMQGITIEEWGVWGTLGDLRLTPTGMATTGGTVTDDINFGWKPAPGAVINAASSVIQIPRVYQDRGIIHSGTSNLVASPFLDTQNL